MINPPNQIPELAERRGMALGPRPIIIIVATGQQFLVMDTVVNISESLSKAKLMPDEERKWVHFKNPQGEKVSLSPWIIDKIVGMFELGGNPCKACQGTGRAQ